ncbi:hypothetical protein WMF30_56360 [Sorangium sp. So ce134]
MKKFARWALAFTAVMSIPGSAMAIAEGCPHSAVINNGVRNIPVGKLVCAYAEQYGDVYNDGCFFSCKWWHAPGPGATVAANLAIYEGLSMANYDCDWSAAGFGQADISLNRNDPLMRNYGINTRFQKVQLSDLFGMKDEQGTMKVMIRYYSALSMPVYGTFAPQCAGP